MANTGRSWSMMRLRMGCDLMSDALVYERVHDNLKRMKLTTMDELLDNYLEIAAKEERSTLEVLDHLLAEEVGNKDARALGLRMRLAGFPMEKRLEDFDTGFQPSLDPVVLRDHASLRLIPNAENVVFLGPPRSGKDSSCHYSRV